MNKIVFHWDRFYLFAWFELYSVPKSTSLCPEIKQTNVIQVTRICDLLTRKCVFCVKLLYMRNVCLVVNKYYVSGLYRCSTCGKTYQHSYTLVRHRKYECGVSPTVQCPHKSCFYRTKYKYSLKSHLRLKHNNKSS